MPSEMLSGPDLGGGYLHQLTIDRTGEATTFTYHAQDGGQDAAGPPIGPLDALAFVHPTDGCQFGGPRCWHRRFLVPFADLPKVRLAYNRFRFVLETMLKQAHADLVPGVDEALVELVRRIAPALDSEGVEWYVGGSTAGRLLGATLTPHDIDLGTHRAGVDRIAQLIPEYLIEPLGPTDWPSRGIVRGARAFVGTFRDGARVEWAVPIDPGAPAGPDEWSGGLAEVKTLPASVGSTTIRVTRPEYGLVRACERGDLGRGAVWTQLVRTVGPDTSLLRALLDRSVLAPAARELLFRSVAV
ncbi:MAG: hypothetical protein L3K02_04295 [Thermoplasmata archaeon]|nr:hypothetical protein [Thermoplasmata archaeon]